VSSGSASSSDRTDLDEEVTGAIGNMYTEEGGYLKLIQALNHELNMTQYDHERIREIAQISKVSKTPIIRSNFNEC
jgi:hypothetical protein